MPMRNPTAIVHNWLCNSWSTEAPPHVLAAQRQLERYETASESHWLDWSAEELQGLLQQVDQQRLVFEAEDEHANVRMAVARYLETVVVPTIRFDERVWKLPRRLREARQTGTCMYRPSDQKWMTIWDTKAELPLLCPDDAREEAMRVQRRYVPAMAAWQQAEPGRAIHKAVLTWENFRPGKLRQGMQLMFKAFKKLMKRFPQIKGSLVTLEAPLSQYRDWNVHLNVLLLCDGFLDYGTLAAAWHWQVEIRRVRPDPKSEETYEGALERELREIVKYPVQCMPSKSAAHAQRSPAPAMLDWTAPEWLEWWDAHQKFRRTRSYGVLFKLKDPEPESMEGFRSIGFVRHDGNRLIRQFPLLDLILGDKSSGKSATEAFRQLLYRLTGPPEALSQARERTEQAMLAWQQIENQL